MSNHLEQIIAKAREQIGPEKRFGKFDNLILRALDELVESAAQVGVKHASHEGRLLRLESSDLKKSPYDSDTWGKVLTGLVNLESLNDTVYDAVPAVGKDVGMKEVNAASDATQEILEALPEFLSSIRKALLLEARQ